MSDGFKTPGSLQFCRDSEKGTTLVEAAIGLLPFCLLLFGLIQVLAFAHFNLSMHFVAAKAARWGVLNQTLLDGNGDALDRVASIKQRFRELAPLYAINPDSVQLRICPASVPNCAVESAGGGGRPFIIHAERRAVFLPGFQFLQPRTSVVITNEPNVGT